VQIVESLEPDGPKDGEYLESSADIADLLDDEVIVYDLEDEPDE
jgi:hypothetical protein